MKVPDGAQIIMAWVEWLHDETLKFNFNDGFNRQRMCVLQVTLLIHFFKIPPKFCDDIFINFLFLRELDPGKTDWQKIPKNYCLRAQSGTRIDNKWSVK